MTTTVDRSAKPAGARCYPLDITPEQFFLALGIHAGGLVLVLAASDHPQTMDGGAPDLIGAAGRRVTIDVEG